MASPTQTGKFRLPMVPTLESRMAHSTLLRAVHKSELRSGDWVRVATRNSVYWICALGEGLYSVSGGWFDRKGLSPQPIGINGCTLGGSAIKQDIIAAPGLFLEFGNHVQTTRILNVRVIRREEQPVC